MKNVWQYDISIKRLCESVLRVCFQIISSFPLRLQSVTDILIQKNSMEQTLGIPTCHLPVKVDNLFRQDGPQSSATDNMDCNALLENGRYVLSPHHDS